MRPLSVSPPPLHNRVALITGGGRGIGRAAALELARLGAGVAILARSANQVAAVAAQVQALDRPALAITADVAHDAEVEAAVERVAAALGPIGILVNGAGRMPLGPLAASDPAEWRYALEVNALGPFHCLRAALPAMLAQGWGRVVNLSSVVATMPAIRNRSAYVVSKAALDRLTVAAAAELAGTGVTVNTVYPGMTDTAMLAQIRDAPVERIGAEQQEVVRRHYARGTLNQPEAVARLIAAVVLSDLQGQVVAMDSDLARQLLQMG
jgi:NAD(P)-dependent dehydrogenase (short-subunit alcohol dehydrogenase family)